MSGANTAVEFQPTERTFPESGLLWIFCSASLMSGRNGRDQRSRALEWSVVISLAFCGACGVVSGGTGGAEPAELGRAHGCHRQAVLSLQGMLVKNIELL